MVFNILMRGSGGPGTNLFTLVTRDRTPGNGMKLSQGRFGLDIRKRIFTQRVTLRGWSCAGLRVALNLSGSRPTQDIL